MRDTTSRSSQSGMALVIALIVLLIVSLLAVVLIMGVTTNRQVVGQGVTGRKALDNAEAGIAEAISRMRNGDIDLSAANPRATAQIFLAQTGNVPSVGVDTTAMGTLQPSGSWLSYSTPGKSPDVLTVRFKTDSARTVIHRYDVTRTPRENTATGLPIYEITSTGRAGITRRTVVTDVVARPIIASTKGALAAGMDVDFVGNAVVCGYNHSASTPPHTGENGRHVNPDCVPYETGSGDLPATWSTGAITNGGAAYQAGYPINNLGGQTGFYSGPWQALGMTQSEFISFVGAPTTTPSSMNGIYWIDNDLVMGNQSGGTAFHNVTGEGMLYVDGDLTLNAGFVYTGLVYVEGNLRLNGQAWILGGLIVRGRTTVLMNGGATILYSSDAITQKLARYGGLYTTLAWREK
jgi:Tfp pilus assembly protein PilX